MIKPVVICVDDEENVLLSLKEQVRRALGSAVFVELAESGEVGLVLMTNIMEGRGEIPLVVSDYLMPGIRGDDFLIRLHIASPKTRTILLTGHADLHAVSKTVNHANLYRYITKPWENEDFYLTLREAYRSYQQEKYIEEQNTQLLQLNRQLIEFNRSLEEKVRERTRELEDAKSKELTTIALHLVQKNQMLTELRERAGHMGELPDISVRKLADEIVRKIDIDAHAEDAWAAFERQFQQLHSDFIRVLYHRYPSLSPTEVRVCALIKIQFGTKEIASFLNISTRTVEDHRNNIRKKTGITPKDNLTAFIGSL